MKNIAVLGLGKLGQDTAFMVEKNRHRWGIGTEGRIYGYNRSSGLEKILCVDEAGFDHVNFMDGGEGSFLTPLTDDRQIFSKEKDIDTVIVAVGSGLDVRSQVKDGFTPFNRYLHYNRVVEYIKHLGTLAGESGYDGRVIIETNPTDPLLYVYAMAYKRASGDLPAEGNALAHNYVDTRRIQSEIYHEFGKMPASKKGEPTELQKTGLHLKAMMLGEHGPNSMFPMSLLYSGIDRLPADLRKKTEAKLPDMVKRAQRRAWKQIMYMGHTSEDTVNALEWVLEAIHRGEGDFVMSTPYDIDGDGKNIVCTGVPFSSTSEGLKIRRDIIKGLPEVEYRDFVNSVRKTRATHDYSDNNRMFPEIRNYLMLPLRVQGEIVDLDSRASDIVVFENGKSSVPSAGMLENRLAGSVKTDEKKHFAVGKLNGFRLYDLEGKKVRSVSFNIVPTSSKAKKYIKSHSFDSFAQIGEYLYALKCGVGIYKIPIGRFFSESEGLGNRARANLLGRLSTVIHPYERSLHRLKTDGKDLYFVASSSIVHMTPDGSVISRRGSEVINYCLAGNDPVYIKKDGSIMFDDRQIDRITGAKPLAGALIDGKQNIFVAEGVEGQGHIFQYVDGTRVGLKKVDAGIRDMLVMESPYPVHLPEEGMRYTHRPRYDLIVGGYEHVHRIPLSIPGIGTRFISDSEQEPGRHKLLRSGIVHTMDRPTRADYRMAVITEDLEGILDI